MAKPFPHLTDITGRFDAAIIDLDGTLLDSMDLWNRVDIEFLAKRGIELTHDYTEYVKRTTIREAAEYTVSRDGLKETPEDVMDEWNSMVSRAYSQEISCKRGAAEYIRELHKAGIRLGIATALVEDNVKAVLKLNGMEDIWDAVLTLDHLGGTVNKSNPDIYLRTAELMGAVPGRTLVFEDVPEAAAGARLGGFATCAVFDEIGCGKCWEAFARECDYSLKDWQNKE